MKAKLIKDHTDYHLVDDKQFIIGTTDESMLSCTDKQKLSLTNCQAIERGYDLDELAKTIFPDKIFTTNEEHEIPIDGSPYQWGFKVGFQKCLGLMADKKFSEKDMLILAIDCWNTASKPRYGATYNINEIVDNFIQSLQQTEWDVEVEMEWVQSTSILGNPHQTPKLDEDGCLILKPLPKE